MKKRKGKAGSSIKKTTEVKETENAKGGGETRRELRKGNRIMEKGKRQVREKDKESRDRCPGPAGGSEDSLSQTGKSIGIVKAVA